MARGTAGSRTPLPDPSARRDERAGSTWPSAVSAEGGGSSASRLSFCLLASLLVFADGPEAQTAARLTVVAQARPTTCFVGQAVVLAVGVAAERERPTVVAPKVDGASVGLVRTEQVPMSASGIGEVLSEKNLFRSVFVVVPKAPGTLTIPPVLARLGERTGRSDPVRLTVRPLPASGRPATFLGGVGRFDVEAKAEPGSLRTGQTFEYRVMVTGPGARGVSGSPAVDRLGVGPLGLRVERLPDVTAVDPPSHTFVYRLRPTRAGAAVLPPVAVSSFDPATERYVTKVTRGVPVKVAEVTPFDPRSLVYGPPPFPDGASAEADGRLLVISAVAAVLLAAAGVAVLWARLRARRRGNGALGRWLTDAEARLTGAPDGAEAGRVLTESLAAYLALTADRPPGALTPAEATEGVARAAGSDELAGRAGRLVALCDRARYAHAGRVADDRLRREGEGLLRSLAAAPVVGERPEPSGPRGGTSDR